MLKNRLAASEDWSDYQRIAAIPAAPLHPCDDLYARVVSGSLTRFDRAAATLWQSPGKHTKQCDEAFSTLIKRSGDVPTAALWKRTVALLKRGSVDDIDNLLRFFGSRDRRIVQSWIDHLDDPETLLKLESVNGNMVHHQQLVSHMLRRWLKTDLPAATAFWKASGSAFGFDQRELDHVIANHAVLAAKRSLPQTPELLADASSGDRLVRYWRVRTALQQLNWNEVLQQLDALTNKEQQSARWRYWRARALEATGQTSQADNIYRELSERVEFYGFLAADRINRTYQVEGQQPVIDKNTVAALAEDNDIATAIEYFLVDIGWEGRRVWNGALKGADQATLLAAAELARSIGWYDRAYASVKKSDKLNVLEYQFPMPHQSLVSSLAEQSTVNESLVYAVMRRESGYIPDVRSSAGAIGLMQLMPATAKEMAAEVPLQKTTWRLIDSEVNIQLGVAYLDKMLRRFDGNVAYAAAAYNAGPSRVSKWRENSDLPTDIWVETIPFDETRDYVKAVLFNAAIFDAVRQQRQKRVIAMMESE
ncbi:MAG: transglycosylase SLT domain-containing protein [Pseudomonadota bacterium]